MKIVVVGIAAYCLLVGIFLFSVTLRAELREERKPRRQLSVLTLPVSTLPAVKGKGEVHDLGIDKAA